MLFQDLENDKETSDEIKFGQEQLNKYLNRDPVYVDDSNDGRVETQSELEDRLLKQFQEDDQNKKNLRVFKHVDEDYDSPINNHHSWPSFEDLLKG